jgi:hypothetical protein
MLNPGSSRGLVPSRSTHSAPGLSTPVPRLPVSRAALSRVSVTPPLSLSLSPVRYTRHSRCAPPRLFSRIRARPPPRPPFATPALRVSLLSSVSRSSASFRLVRYDEYRRWSCPLSLSTLLTRHARSAVTERSLLQPVSSRSQDLTFALLASFLRRRTLPLFTQFLYDYPYLS